MTWNYLPVLNICLQILSSICIGAVMGKFAPNVFNLTFVEHSVQFVMRIALPCLITRGIGVGIDFYSETFLWKYIAAFLLLRLLALFFAILSNLRFRTSEKVIGNIAVEWLSLTWISTVILGVPILTTIMDSKSKGIFYGILAGISSFMFQLPFQIAFLEYHRFGQDAQIIDADTNGTTLNNDPTGAEEGSKEKEDDQGEVCHTPRSKCQTYTELFKLIICQLCCNPVIWGIICGFIISLSTLGKRFLRRYMIDGKTRNEDYIEGLQFIVDTLNWFGNCVSPLSLFSMGIWMQNKGRRIISISLSELVISIFMKLIVIPFLMIGLAKALKLDDEAGRASVIIASLPISMASFSLGSAFKVGEDKLSANVATGTFLMLPTVLLWNYAMDKLDLFAQF